jgi:hypothetical protein
LPFYWIVLQSYFGAIVLSVPSLPSSAICNHIAAFIYNDSLHRNGFATHRRMAYVTKGVKDIVYNISKVSF